MCPFVQLNCLIVNIDIGNKSNVIIFRENCSLGSFGSDLVRKVVASVIEVGVRNIPTTSSLTHLLRVSKSG